MPARWPRSRTKSEPKALNGDAADGLGIIAREQQDKEQVLPGADAGMPGLQAFAYGERCVRAVERAGQVWFVAQDVCDVLGLANSRQALRKLDKSEKGVTESDTLGGVQKMAVVNESGALYLMLRSHKPEAKAFRLWVTGVVLPTILRTGSYIKTPPGSTNTPHVTLPGPGRYIAFMTEDGRVTCQPASHEEAAARIYFAEGRVLVHMLKLIEAQWSIVQQSRVFENDPRPIPGAGPLHQAITEGSRLASQFLPCWDMTARRQP